MMKQQRASTADSSFTVINARSIDGRWFGFRVVGGRFAEVWAEKGSVKPGAGVAVSLDEFNNVGGLPDSLATDHPEGGSLVVDWRGEIALPGAVDIHVHSRDPGLTDKETWQTLAQGAFKGGVTAVCDMPNTIPPTITREAVLDKAKRARGSGIHFGIYLGVGQNNLETLAELITDRSLPVCGIKVFYGPTTGDLVFSDLAALDQALPGNLGLPIVFHAEDEAVIERNRRKYSRAMAVAETASQGHKPGAFAVHSQLRDKKVAFAATHAILRWAEETGRRVHIAHCATAEEVKAVTESRRRGALVTCEVAPHHLLFSTRDYDTMAGFLKVNPPVRPSREVLALRRSVRGNVKAFATDHAPHLPHEKEMPYSCCPSGLPSVEWFYPLVFHVARLCGIKPRDAVMMATNGPAQVIGRKELEAFRVGGEANFVWYKKGSYRVPEDGVVSKCGWTPYAGMILPGKVLGTWRLGQCVWSASDHSNSPQ